MKSYILIFAIADIAIADTNFYLALFKKAVMFFKNRCDIIKLRRIVGSLLDQIQRAFFFAFFGAGKCGVSYPFAAPPFRKE